MNYQPGDQKSALCHRDGRVTVTMTLQDVPFRETEGCAKQILVGVCDVCGDAVLVPAQSTPAIAEALIEAESATAPSLPVYIEQEKQRQVRTTEELKKSGNYADVPLGMD